MKITIEFGDKKYSKLKKDFNNIIESFMFIATVTFLVCSIIYFGREGEWLAMFIGLVSACLFFCLLCDASKMQKEINMLKIERKIMIEKNNKIIKKKKGERI